MSNYNNGINAAKAYYSSQGFASLTRYPRPQDVIKLFLPPVKEHRTQMRTPMPKDRVEWMEGFKAQTNKENG